MRKVLPGFCLSSVVASAHDRDPHPHQLRINMGYAEASGFPPEFLVDSGDVHDPLMKFKKEVLPLFREHFRRQILYPLPYEYTYFNFDSISSEMDLVLKVFNGLCVRLKKYPESKIFDGKTFDLDSVSIKKHYKVFLREFSPRLDYYLGLYNRMSVPDSIVKLNNVIGIIEKDKRSYEDLVRGGTAESSPLFFYCDLLFHECLVVYPEDASFKLALSGSDSKKNNLLRSLIKDVVGEGMLLTRASSNFMVHIHEVFNDLKLIFNKPEIFTELSGQYFDFFDLFLELLGDKLLPKNRVKFLSMASNPDLLNLPRGGAAFNSELIGSNFDFLKRTLDALKKDGHIKLFAIDGDNTVELMRLAFCVMQMWCAEKDIEHHAAKLSGGALDTNDVLPFMFLNLIKYGLQSESVDQLGKNERAYQEKCKHCLVWDKLKSLVDEYWALVESKELPGSPKGRVYTDPSAQTPAYSGHRHRTASPGRIGKIGDLSADTSEGDSVLSSGVSLGFTPRVLCLESSFSGPEKPSGPGGLSPIYGPSDDEGDVGECILNLSSGSGDNLDLLSTLDRGRLVDDAGFLGLSAVSGGSGVSVDSPDKEDFNF